MQHFGKKPINTLQAPQAIGTYSQAVRVGNVLYISGQIAMTADSGEIIGSDFRSQAYQVFENLQHIAEAANGRINDTVKLTLYVTDMDNFPIVNAVMAEFFNPPYPARATVEVSALPKGALVEADAILYLGEALGSN